MIYTCCDLNRHAAVERHPSLNGIDWLEVLDRDAPADSPRQRTLLLRLLKPVPAGLSGDNVRISGGERIRDVAVVWAAPADEPPPQASAGELTLFAGLDDAAQVLVVRTDSEGDFSAYRLQLVRGTGDDAPPDGFDPCLVAVEFSFKVECPSDFDCSPERSCDEPPAPPPDLNYLARDYESLRRLVVDRLSAAMPGWRDRSPADLATTVAELIAYVGDLQHYQLDAVATEAYLATARRRSSVRRHALLVDYPMHNGSNARTWLHLEVGGGPFALPEGIRFYTRVSGVPPRIEPDSSDERGALQAQPLVFEPMQAATLREDHNRFVFHTWGDGRCCLARGATRATLRGHWPALASGDVLILLEVRGALTGFAEDSDPARRHAVRLTAVRAFARAADPDAAAVPLTDPLDGTEITEITWHPGDALPFPLCLSSQAGEGAGGHPIEEMSIALGNNILVDHGRSIVDEPIGEVPPARLHYPPASAEPCGRPSPEPLPVRFRPQLAHGPVTHQGTVRGASLRQRAPGVTTPRFDPDAAASAALHWRVEDALPVLSLVSGLGGADEQSWSAARDLLDSKPDDARFVLEVEEDGSARVRFGDGRHGRRPDGGTVFHARYRVGNGAAGNVGANAIAHAVTREDRIEAVVNPLPARGGRSPESVAAVRRRAPHAFRTQQRAVTPADYAEVTERLPGVQRATATLRWTGSWHSVFINIDRSGGDPVDRDFADVAVRHLDSFRMAGHDVRIRDPIRVSLEIELLVCVADGYFRSEVRRGLLGVLGSHTRSDGSRALFHPDNFSFGQTVYLSRVLAAARAVAGVTSVQALHFSRQGSHAAAALGDGLMRLGSLEIARLDNDPNHPEHGVLRLQLHGGK